MPMRHLTKYWASFMRGCLVACSLAVLSIRLSTIVLILIVGRKNVSAIAFSKLGLNSGIFVDAEKVSPPIASTETYLQS